MSKIFEDLFKSCKGNVILMKKTLLELEKDLNKYVNNAKKNGIDDITSDNFKKEFGLNDSPLEKFYFQEAKFRLKEYFEIPNPSYELLDKIVDSWFNDECVLNYDLLDNTIHEILVKSSNYHLFYKLDNRDYCDSFGDYESAKMYYEEYKNHGIYDYVILQQFFIRDGVPNSLELVSWYKEDGSKE